MPQADRNRASARAEQSRRKAVSRVSDPPAPPEYLRSARRWYSPRSRRPRRRQPAYIIRLHLRCARNTALGLWQPGHSGRGKLVIGCHRHRFRMPRRDRQWSGCRALRRAFAASPALGVLKASSPSNVTFGARLKPLFESSRQPEGLRRCGFGGAGGEAEVKTARANLADARLNLGYPGSRRRLRASPAARSAPKELRLRSGRPADDGIADRSDLLLFSVSTRNASGLPARPTRGAHAARRAVRVTVKLADGSVYSETGSPTSPTCASPAARAPAKRAPSCPIPRLPAPRPVRARCLKGAERLVRSWCRSARARRSKGKFVYVVNAESKAEPRRSSLATGRQCLDCNGGPQRRRQGDRGRVMKIGRARPCCRALQPRETDPRRMGPPKAEGRAPVVAQSKGASTCFLVFHRPPDFRAVLSIFIVIAGLARCAPCDRQYPEIAPPVSRHGELPGRLGRCDRATVRRRWRTRSTASST